MADQPANNPDVAGLARELEVDLSYPCIHEKPHLPKAICTRCRMTVFEAALLRAYKAGMLRAAEIAEELSWYDHGSQRGKAMMIAAAIRAEAEENA